MCQKAGSLTLSGKFIIFVLESNNDNRAEITA